MGSFLPVVDLGAGMTAKSISASSHVCAVRNDDSIVCWGESGTYGKLGVGSTNHVGDEAGEMGESLVPVDLGSL
jgi:hypothetical protein